MTSNAYVYGIDRVKEQLSKYSHLSILDLTLKHLASKTADPADKNSMMPWVVMFLLKLSMLGKDGEEAVSFREFNRIANDIFHLQGPAADLNEGEIELKIRALILGQMLYQRDTLHSLRELFVQGSILTRADNYYDNVFHKIFGLSLDSYLKIAMFVVVRLDKQPVGVLEMPISELVFYLCPGLPYSDVLAFVRLASCDAHSLSNFVSEYELKGVFASEYFQETPFKNIPFILRGPGLVAFNYQFCITALCSLAPAVLKKEYPAFKDEFGADMELRVGEVLKTLKHDEMFSESDVRDILKAKGIVSKVVDYVIREGDLITFVECKAIEPSDLVKCTADAQILKSNLAPNYIKAIHQGQAVAHGLAGMEQFKDCSFRMLVVTFGDHYVFGGKYISENIDTNLEDEIRRRYGDVPLAMDRIAYLPLQSFAGLIHGLNDRDRPLGAFLDTVCDAQVDPQKRRFTLADSVEDEIGIVPGSFAAGLGEELSRKQSAMEALMKGNVQYWSGKAGQFISKHEDFLRALNPTYSDLKT